MPGQLLLRIDHKRFFLYAIAVAVLNILMASSANAQQTWTITVSPTGNDSKPGYSVSPTTATGTGTCKYPTQQIAKKLYVCPGDTVLWAVSSPSSTYQMYLFCEDSILFKATGATHWFDISHTGVRQDGGKITLNAAQAGYHDYSLAVFEPTARRLYIEDPKIIIGTGTVEDDIRAKSLKLEELVTGEEAKQKARDILKDIDKDLKQLSPPK